eukprot:TRINITY_DN12792_c0_g1_i1.p1 TRINITY_DN12792_c0_g1~~TRINITY_DN12792_c0_g1_i1.p1  ORF type:complete len:449 (-),score=84.82 TRINITY_DN12792_c0_g1_i1:347-1693(-)
MWTPQDHRGYLPWSQDHGVYAPWPPDVTPPGVEADYGNSPGSGASASHLTGSTSAGMSPAVSSAFDASAAGHLAPALKGQVQDLQTRVQKLERSRGQITKDIHQMMAEAREMRQILDMREVRCKDPAVVGLGAAIRQGARPAPPPALPPAAPATAGSTRARPAPPPALPPAAPATAASTRQTPVSTAKAPVPAAKPTEPAEVPPRGVVSADSRKASRRKVVSDDLSPPPGLGWPGPPLSAVSTPASPFLSQEAITVWEKADCPVGVVARVEWRVDNVLAKFRECVGRPLVSQPFDMVGLSDCRIMVSPNLGADASGLSSREQRGKYEARLQARDKAGRIPRDLLSQRPQLSRIEALLSDGPLSGNLKFKVVSSVGDENKMRFSFFVGSVVEGPLSHDFAEHVLCGVDFTNNWLDQLQGSPAALIVGVEIFEMPGVAHSGGDTDSASGA